MNKSIRNKMTTEEKLFCIRETISTEFLTEQWERELYLSSLALAIIWGNKQTQKNKEYFSKNHLIDRYNV